LESNSPQIYAEHIPARLRNAHTPNQNKPVNLLGDLDSKTKPIGWRKKSRELLSKQKKFINTIRGSRPGHDSNTLTNDPNSGNQTNIALQNNNPKKENKRRQYSLMAGEFLARLHLAPFQVIAEMPLSKIYTLFHILKPENVYVTKYSRLIGVITELHLLEIEKQFQSNKDGQPLCIPNCRWPKRR